MDSAFMNAIARGVGAAGCRVVRFEFPYMRARRDEGLPFILALEEPELLERFERELGELVDRYRLLTENPIWRSHTAHLVPPLALLIATAHARVRTLAIWTVAATALLAAGAASATSAEPVNAPSSCSNSSSAVARSNMELLIDSREPSRSSPTRSSDELMK